MLNGNYVILSIDFDYFVNASGKYRNLLFPDGHDDLSENLQKIVWDRYYPKIEEIGVKTEEFNRLIEYCKKTKAYRHRFTAAVQSYESHKWLYDLVCCHQIADKSHIFNIDFHHDMFCMPHTDSRVDCGNWGRVLKEENPNFKLTWIADNDSQREDITGEQVDCYEIWDFEDLMQNLDPADVDVIFMCRSNMWSPPHLDKYYKELELQILGEQQLEEREVL